MGSKDACLILPSIFGIPISIENFSCNPSYTASSAWRPPGPDATLALHTKDTGDGSGDGTKCAMGCYGMVDVQWEILGILWFLWYLEVLGCKGYLS